jgi:hypothetical protein
MSVALSMNLPSPVISEQPPRLPPASESKMLMPDVAGESEGATLDVAGESEAPVLDVARPAASPERQETTAAGWELPWLKQQYGIFGGDELPPVISKLPASTTHLVEGLIPPRSVNILVGDSGIGKSPLAYQLGLAVASGRPFLDMPVKPGKVLLVDFENSLADVHWIMEQQRKHLGLTGFPRTFQVWPVHLDPSPGTVEQVIAMFAPDLVILDSLRSFSRTMESDNAAAVDHVRRLRVTSASYGTAFLLIHHVRKQQPMGRFGRPAGLEEGDVMDWLLRASGVRALINQTDVRLALARRGRSAGAEEAGLVLRGHFRSRGEVGPFLLRRKRSDGDGEPLGYERFAAHAGLLDNEEQEAFFARLPEKFSFKDVRLGWGKSHDSAHFLIHKMMRLGLVRRAAYGQYLKAGCVSESTF